MAPGRSRVSADMMVPIRIESYRFYFRHGVPAISARGSRLLPPRGPGRELVGGRYVPTGRLFGHGKFRPDRHVIR